MIRLLTTLHAAVKWVAERFAPKCEYCRAVSWDLEREVWPDDQYSSLGRDTYLCPECRRMYARKLERRLDKFSE